jgi:hypothetical protein
VPPEAPASSEGLHANAGLRELFKHKPEQLALPNSAATATAASWPWQVHFSRTRKKRVGADDQASAERLEFANRMVERKVGPGPAGRGEELSLARLKPRFHHSQATNLL